MTAWYQRDCDMFVLLIYRIPHRSESATVLSLRNEQMSLVLTRVMFFLPLRLLYLIN